MNEHEQNLHVLSELYSIITPSKREMFDRIAANRTRHVTVALENIYQEHNASAVMRSCDCFGIQELHVIEKDNPYKIQRDIALGAGRWVDLFTYDQEMSPETQCINQLRSQGYRIVATSPHGDIPSIHDIDVTKPFALIFGTERRGISEEVKLAADEFVRIPMYGFSESFNISVSVALMLNVFRQRLEESDIGWKLSEIEQTNLKLTWCKSILNGGQHIEAEIRRHLLEKE